MQYKYIFGGFHIDISEFINVHWINSLYYFYIHNKKRFFCFKNFNFCIISDFVCIKDNKDMRELQIDDSMT